MKILYIGSAESKELFQKALGNTAVLTSEKNSDACLIEITDTATLFRLPKKFAVPTYFYLTVKDRKIIEAMKEFKISGIFFPPLKADDVKKKFLGATKSKNGSKSTINEFDTLKAKIIAKAENIPPLPTLARDLISLTRNDKSQMKDFIEKIKMDQGLSSRIIKLVNSPFYGLRQDVSSLDRATVLLGLNTLKNLALAISTEQFFSKNFSLYKSTGQKLWDHSFLVARLCELLAKVADEDEDSLYLAGLMHDIGKTVLVDFLVKEVDGTEDEVAQLGTDHSAVGELVLSKWAVVNLIVDAVRQHHQPPTTKFNAVLYYANELAKKHGAYKVVEDASTALNCTTEELAEAISPIFTAISEEGENNEQDKQDEHSEETY